MASTVWKGHLSFGLVSIPVRLYRAAMAEKVSCRQLHSTAPTQHAEAQPDMLPIGPAPIRSTRRGDSEAIHEVERKASEIAQPAPPSVAPIRNTPTSAENAQPIPHTEIVKGYEYQPEQYVLVSNDELRRITPPTSSDIQILEFVHLGEIDPVY
jgi:DNA end-binding protein Ku